MPPYSNQKGNNHLRSKVLAMRVHDMTEEHIRDAVSPYMDGQELPLFLQWKKSLAFVEFPNVDEAQRCLDFINDGGIIANNGESVTAHFSNRDKVTTSSDGGNQTRTGGYGNQGGGGYNNGGGYGNDNFSGVKRQRDDYGGNNNMPNKRPNNHMGGAFNADRGSPVLCIKSDLDESDTNQFFSELSNNHGLPRAEDFLVISGKSMAFVQFPSVDQAKIVLDHFEAAAYVTPQGLAMTAVFSKRKKIERNEQARMASQANINPQVNLAAQEIAQNLSQQHGGYGGGQQINMNLTSGGMGHSGSSGNTVLLVTLRPIRGDKVNVTAENMLLPFSRYGVVHKVIVWSKQDKTDVQALVQYAEPKYASYALEEMDGTHIGEFKVMLKYSEKQEIEVGSNNERCRDFTNPWLTQA